MALQNVSLRPAPRSLDGRSDAPPKDVHAGRAAPPHATTGAPTEPHETTSGPRAPAAPSRYEPPATSRDGLRLVTGERPAPSRAPPKMPGGDAPVDVSSLYAEDPAAAKPPYTPAQQRDMHASITRGAYSETTAAAESAKFLPKGTTEESGRRLDHAASFDLDGKSQAVFDLHQGWFKRSEGGPLVRMSDDEVKAVRKHFEGFAEPQNDAADDLQQYGCGRPL